MLHFPSNYTHVEPQQPQMGEEVVFLGEHYTVLMLLNLSIGPHPNWKPGLYCLLWKPEWAKPQTIIAPLGDVQRPTRLSA